MTRLDKLCKFRRGEYVFKAPPVCTTFWDEDDWVNYIDINNWWR